MPTPLTKEEVESFYSNPEGFDTRRRTMFEVFEGKDILGSELFKQNIDNYALISATAVDNPGQGRLGYYGQYFGSGDYEYYYTIWFDFSTPQKSPVVYILLSNHYNNSYSGPMEQQNTDFVLLSNTEGGDHARFCEYLPADTFGDYKSRFSTYSPRFGINCLGTLGSNQMASPLSWINLASRQKPFDIAFTSYQTEYHTSHRIEYCTFRDFTLLVGTHSLNSPLPDIKFTSLAIGFRLLETKTISSEQDLAFSLKGGIELMELAMEFEGYYSGNDHGCISLSGAVKTLPPALINDHPAQTGWLQNLDLKTSMALSFDKNFSLTAYEMTAMASHVSGLIPDTPLKIPVNITDAGIRLEGENFSSTPSVELSFTTTLFGELAIDAVMSYPEKYIMARLNREAAAWNLTGLLGKLGITPPSALASLTIADLELEANLSEKSYRFGMELNSVLSLGVFTLENLWVDFRYEGESDSADWELAVRGLFDIGGVEFLASVTYARTEKEGTFVLTAESSEDTPIRIGEFIEKLVSKLGIQPLTFPDEIRDFEIDSISLNLESSGGSKKFEFNLQGSSTIADRDLAWSITLSIEQEETDTPASDTSSASSKKKETSTSCRIAGSVSYYECRFALDFRKEGDQTVFLATLSGDNEATSVTRLIEQLILDEEGSFPVEIEIPLPKIFFILKPAKKDEKTIVLFGIDLGLSGEIDFSVLPGIGPLLKNKVNVSVNALRIVGCSGEVDKEGLSLMNAALAENDFAELSGQSEDADHGPVAVLSKGIAVRADLRLADYEITLEHFFEIGRKKEDDEADETITALPEPSDNTPVPQEKAADETAGEKKQGITAAKPASATPVGRRLGPLLIEKIGLGYEEGKMELQFTGGVMVGPFTMELIDLVVSSPIDRFAPEFDMDGLSAAYDKSPVLVSGLLQRHHADLGGGRKISGFRGGISVGLKQVAITAIAAYDRDESPDAVVNSFFIYGFLSAPLGGPPFLFVTGLALGGGFNRALNQPLPEQLALFPLTAAALSPGGMTLDFEALESIQQNFPVKDGAFWIAAGIRFESFKFLSGFLMLTLEFGEETKIGVLGILDASITAGKDRAIARITLGFTAAYLPDRGVMEVRGAFLPTTFILHKDVKVQGGMAFLAILKDQDRGEWKGAKAGEFVLTLGGYGPLYQPKPYYPAVPALQLSWKVSNLLTINASAYFAVTPEAIMLGGVIRGLFTYTDRILKHDLSIIAQFTIAVDFILYWQPIRYLGKASVEFQVKGSVDGWLITESIHLLAAAEMTIWGPDFSGKAILKLNLLRTFSIDVEFGKADREIKPLTWAEFREKLLPPAQKVVSLNLVGGVTPESVQNEAPSVDPQKMLLIADTQIPVKKLAGKPYENMEVGIKPMGVTSTNFESNVEISICLNGQEDKQLHEKMIITPVFKNVPSALWQPAVSEGLIPAKDGRSGLIEQVVCGYEIRVKPPEFQDKIDLQPSTVDDVLEGPVAPMGQKPSYQPLTGKPELAVDETIIRIFNPS